MQSQVEKDKLLTKTTLKAGLDNACADDITEAMINLEDGTCDYIELIPVLEEIASVDWFCYFDDNGAGGFPHADHRRKSSFKSWAQKAIENIKANALLESSSTTAAVLKSNSTSLLQTTLEQLKSNGTSTDKSLIPILEKIARKDVYKSYSYQNGFKTECRLGELANEVVQLIQQSKGLNAKEDGPATDQIKYEC